MRGRSMRAIARLALVLLTVLGLSAQAQALTFVFDTPISGDTVSVTVTLTDVAGGVDIDVSIPSGEGDLLGIFGNVTDETLVPNLSVQDPVGVVAQSEFRANKVFKVGTGNVMTPVKNWDWGLMLGATGSSGGFLETASFGLRAPGLTVATIIEASNQGYVLGIRIQSTGGPEGSSKMGLGDDVLPNQPPTVEITSPQDGLLTSAPTQTVTGTVAGSGAVGIDVDGVITNATVSGGTFTATVTLVEGPNTITASATNTAGTSQDHADVILDTTPPAITISFPADGTLTTALSVTVTGTASDLNGVTEVVVNGIVATLTGDAFEAVDVPLALGANPLVATATDTAGNSGSASVTVTRGEPPTISISSPSDGSLLGDLQVQVSGSAPGANVVDVNGTTATLTGSAFTASLTLVEGLNTITASASNPFGTATDSVSVTVDTTPPTVTITVPSDGSELASTPTAVSGTVIDASPITAITVNGDPVTPGNSFDTTAALVDGANVIFASATDAAGNTGSASVSVTLVVGQPLSVTIETPLDTAILATKVATVAGFVSDPTALVRVNGVLATVTGAQYVAVGVPLVEGQNLVTATAERGADTAQDSVTVTFNKPPTIQILDPSDGSLTPNAETDVEGVVDDPTAFVDVNGVVATVGSAGRFVANGVLLNPGENTLTARAIDVAGAQGTDTVTVLRDDATAGRLRLVMVIPSRDPFFTGGPSARIVAEDFEDFRMAFANLGLPTEQFAPELEDPTIGAFDVPVFIELYVFAEFGEIGQTVSVPAIFDRFFSGPSEKPLEPMSNLDADIASAGLPPSIRDELVPTDFEANGFVHLAFVVFGGPQ